MSRLNRTAIKNNVFALALVFTGLALLLFFPAAYFSPAVTIKASRMLMVVAFATIALWFALEVWPVRKKRPAGDNKTVTESTDSDEENKNNVVSLADKTKPLRYSAMTGQAQYTPTNKPVPKPTEKPAETAPSLDSAPGPEITNDDVFTAEHGYRPAKYMLAYQTKIEKFIARKLAALDGVKPWTVSPPFASLNSITIDINPADRPTLLYSTDFQTELLTRLPDGSELRKAGNGRKYSSIVIPRKSREFIMTIDALPTFERTAKSRTAMMLGYDTDMNIIGFDFAEHPHVVVLGESGSGKGVSVHNALMSLLLRNKPNDLNVVRLDPKGTTLKLYEGLPHMLGDLAKEPLDICERVDWLISEMERRNEIIGAAGCEDAIEYNQANPKSKLPAIVVVFDEMLDFYKTLDDCDDAKALSDTVTGQLERLVNKARSTAIHLILITQVGSDTRLKKIYKGVTSSVVFACKKHAAMQLIADDGELYRVERLTWLGHGMLLHGADVTEFQAPSTLIKTNGRITADCRGDVIKSIRAKWRTHPPAMIEHPVESEPATDRFNCDEKDIDIYPDVIKHVALQTTVDRKLIMAEFGIGATRANRIIKAMADDGFVSESQGKKPRLVLKKARSFTGPTPVQDRSNVGLRLV